MKNFRKPPYRGVFVRAAILLGIDGVNAARIAYNRYRRGQSEARIVVDGLVKKRERSESKRIAELQQSIELEAI